MRLLLLILAFLLIEPAPLDAVATAVRELPLAGPVAERDAEISDMAWRGDELLLLPQYPDWRSPGGAGVLFALPRAALERAADGDQTPLTPREISVSVAEVRASVPGFRGLEAIAFTGPDQAVLTVEASDAGRTRAYLVAARMDSDGQTLRILAQTLVETPLPVQLPNMGVEALVWDGRTLTAFFEANGRNVNPAPTAAYHDAELRLLGVRPAPALEYRLTAATPPDAEGFFWAVNYFWPGERALLRPPPEADPPAQVERLVRMRLTSGGVALDRTPSIDLLPGDEPRNWEAVAILPGRGFLLATDKHPRTILGFVPAP